jgi:hypothetical protein
MPGTIIPALAPMGGSGARPGLLEGGAGVLDECFLPPEQPAMTAAVMPNATVARPMLPIFRPSL